MKHTFGLSLSACGHRRDVGGLVFGQQRLSPEPCTLSKRKGEHVRCPNAEKMPTSLGAEGGRLSGHVLGPAFHT